MEAVVAIDLGNEKMKDNESFTQWFTNKGYHIDDESIFNNTKPFEPIIKYDNYSRAGIFIFKFETDGEYFPPLLTEFISQMEDLKNTQVSVAQEGDYGEYNTLVDMTLSDFKNHIIDGEDVEIEGSETQWWLKNGNVKIAIVLHTIRGCVENAQNMMVMEIL